MTVFHLCSAVIAGWLIVSTLLNLTKHPHWYIRLWDFPRVLVMLLAGALAIVHVSFFHVTWWDWLLLAGLAFVVGRQIWMIWPYTPWAKTVVVRSDKPAGDHTLRLVISNVLMENESRDKWLSVIRRANADVIVALEPNAKWDAFLAQLETDYPHSVRRPQENYYGMVIYSKLPFESEPDVRFMVHGDVPSTHLMLKLRDGQHVRLHAMHPRPPEPIRNQDSAPRDAELIALAKEIDEKQREMPTIVCGDLNDVAWSFTTQLFLRISGLLDPRKGRGQYNSFNANSHLMRFPLDHVFHSNEFKLLDLQRLPHAGSDHFPMLIALSCEPDEARRDQPDDKADAGDHEDANEILEKQSEA